MGHAHLGRGQRHRGLGHGGDDHGCRVRVLAGAGAGRRSRAADVHGRQAVLGDVAAMWPLVMILPLLALAPFFCTDAGPGWPSVVRDRFLLVLAWSGAVALTWLEPGVGLFAGVVLCHWRSPKGVGALVTVGAGIVLFLAARSLPGDWFPLVTWAIVIGVVVQVVLALIQVGVAMAAGQNWHVVRESARGTVGNRVVLGCLCALAWPLATVWWVVPLFVGLALTRSFSALVAAAVAAAVLSPPLWWLVAGFGVLG